MTRTVLHGEAGRAQKMHETVLAAPGKGFEMVKPGVPASDV
jgi:Xaa-Pro aminopeptidase